MGRDTNILWTNSTLNLAWGCTKVSEECRNCYMYRMSGSLGRDPYTVEILGPHRKPWNVDPAVQQIGRFADQNPAYLEYIENRIRGLKKGMIFVNSMSDTFHEDIPEEVLKMWFAIFETHPERQFQILTKRPGRARNFFRGRKVPNNCWLGVSVGMAAAKSRIDILREIDASLRFLSCEPLIEDLGEMNLDGIHWVIVGGESDREKPREMKLEWAESIRRACDAKGVAFFFKQVGGVGGDGAGGDLLNGVRYQEWPR